jgi:hypothetical protein
LVSRPGEWPWSSVHNYTGSVQRPVATPGGLAVDRVLLPADERTGISRYGQEKPQRNAKGAYLCATRFFDRALRAVKEYNAKVEYIHWNPVKAGLVSRLEEWPWSSVHDYTGSAQRPVATPGGLAVDHVLLPADERTRISRYGQEKPQRNAKGAYLCATRYRLALVGYSASEPWTAAAASKRN